MTGHIYQGHCPDELQPHARDANCLACRAMDRAISLDELQPLVADLQLAHYIHLGASDVRHNTAVECLRGLVYR